MYSYIHIFSLLKVSLAATDCIASLDFIHLTQDRVRIEAAVMNRWIVHNATTFLTRRATTSSPIRILYYGPKILFLTYLKTDIFDRVSLQFMFPSEQQICHPKSLCGNFMFRLLIQWNLPITEPQGTGIFFFHCRKVPFNTGTSIFGPQENIPETVKVFL
jgi:hypothetical protein